ncbi:hypothetical protein DXG01_008621, partial [Tephrocybe rancida]
SARDKALAGKQTEEGKWSRFMRDNPAVHAEKKAAKKRSTRRNFSDGDDED